MSKWLRGEICADRFEREAALSDERHFSPNERYRQRARRVISSGGMDFSFARDLSAPFGCRAVARPHLWRKAPTWA
jgi:hypothetical protein